MFQKMKLKTKMLTVGIVLCVLPVVIISAIIFTQNEKNLTNVSKESTRQAYRQLDNTADAVYSLCQTQHELLGKYLESSMNVATQLMEKQGDVNFSEETVDWQATNQFTKNVKNVQLPKMVVGNSEIKKTSELGTKVPIVDDTKDLTSVTCTIFQRMNEHGDMLRIATNVLKKDGSRAVGTYIPKTNPDGTTNEVVSKVLSGQVYTGRAFVVNKWYLTKYKPIFGGDKGNKVVGILYVGVPQESVQSLRQAVIDTKVGKTGYVYVLDSKGNYVISAGGKRDGENIWNAKDADGDFLVQEVIKTAHELNPDEIGEHQYFWKNAEDEKARNKIVRIKYFKPWDWVIGVGSYEDEFYEARDNMAESVKKASVEILIIAGVSVAVSGLVWFLVANGIGNKLQNIIAQLTEGSEQVTSAATQVSSASQSLAEGATEQAAGLEETSSSLEEMSSMTKQNADNANQANTLSNQTSQSAQQGSEAMGRMNSAIADIQKSSEETSKIIKVIDEIAFQTNLLALNAAVEAARAGEAGKGFAVVAEEVRNLAMRSAEAAKDTTALIDESVKNSKNGVEVAGEVNKKLEEITGNVTKSSELIAEIAAASNEQAQGIEQVNQAVTQMDKVTQSNAANAEESASAAEELTSQAESVNSIVGQLIAMVGGSSSKKQSCSSKPAKTKKPSKDIYHEIADGGSNRQNAEEVIPMNDKQFSDFS